jgi:hypothetical protein
MPKGAVMTFFNSLPRLVQFILLLIPGVNWVTELIVRITAVIESPKGTHNILGLVLSIIPFTGVILGYVDLVWVLVNKHLLWAND